MSFNPPSNGEPRPTALEIIEREHAGQRLAGKVALITGATSGIGVETAKALAQAGIHLFLPVRDRAAGEALVADIQRNSKTTSSIQLLSLDLNDLQSVRQCGKEFLSKSHELHILINNAGVMATPEGKTKDGFETQFGINHLAHFLLFQLLKPTLIASSTPSFHSRVICLSSSGHNRSPIHFDDYDLTQHGYDPWIAYGQSKTATLYQATEIERRYAGQHLHAWAVQPGSILTNLQQHMPEEQRRYFFYEADGSLHRRLKTPEEGAATTVWAAVAEGLEGQGGKYLENVAVSKGLNRPEDGPAVVGYAPWAYDQEAARRLWKESLKMVGLPEEH